MATEMSSRAFDPTAAVSMRQAGAAGLLGCALGVAGTIAVLVYGDADVGDPRLLYDLTFGLLAMSGAPTAIALGSYAALVLRSTGLPRWTAWLGVVGALAHVALLASFVVSEGFFSLQGQVITAVPATLFAWIIGTGIAMLATEQ